MSVTETPLTVIVQSRNSFMYACLLNKAVQEGRITPASLPEELRLQDEGGHWVSFRPHYTGSDTFKSETSSLIRITLGATAISVNKALEVIYGKISAKDVKDTSSKGSARVLLYQIRCAFAHDVLNPVWTVRSDSYNQEYRVALKITPSIGETIIGEPIKIVIPFRPLSLKGQPLRLKHIGGMSGYLALLHYWLHKVEAHPKGNQPYALPSAES